MRRPKQHWQAGRAGGASRARVALASLLGLFLLWFVFVLRLDLQPASSAATVAATVNDAAPGLRQPEPGQEHASPEPSGEPSGEASGADAAKGCDYVRDLLATGEAMGPPLPESGKQTRGITFWLKAPVLHTRDPASNLEVMVLKYNIYNKSPSWTQHTDKFTNTVRVLRDNRAARLFPRLFGSCADIDGLHYIAVEYVDFEMSMLPRPTSPQECMDRAIAVMDVFVELDEDMHLFLADVKPGQWMARRDGSLVLQDVDDIVPGHTPVIYQEQARWHQGRLRSELGVSTAEMARIWDEVWFPGGLLTSRYQVINTKHILGNIGFNLLDRHVCDMGEPFTTCSKALFKWTLDTGADWPSQKQVRDALADCFHKGAFERTPRPPASWRDPPSSSSPSS